MPLSRTVNGDFSRKSKNFLTPVYFAGICAPADSSPLQLGIGSWSQKTRMMGLPGRERSLTTSSAVWIQYTPTWQTDTGRQQRPSLYQ